MSAGVIVPVILSGGAGTRLWPLSRRLRPKQFLPLMSDRTLFQDTLMRLDGPAFGPALAVGSDDHRFLIAEQFLELGLPCRSILLEPVGRNTAPAVTAAALTIARDDPGAVMLVMPSDHVIARVDRFLGAVDTAAAAARDGRLVTFGIEPTRPETGYGYIRAGVPLDGRDDAFVLDRFTEKPDLQTAKTFLREGTYLWNSGMFVFTAECLLAEMDRLQPDLLAGCRAAVDGGAADMDFLRLDKDAFSALNGISLDVAVMEQTDAAAVVRTDIGWRDVGAWSSLWEAGGADAQGNVAAGDVRLEDCENSLVRSDKPFVAATGLKDMLVVATDDAVLVMPRDQAQKVGNVVDWLNDQGRDEHVAHKRVYRPWGYYQNLDAGDGFQVKQIMVKPGQQLSLQYHHHRAEHWVIVEGTARVTNGDDILELGPNQSTYIPVGAQHRLENPGDGPLRLIEVQSGDYLGEDDIVRLEDTYGRD